MASALQLVDTLRDCDVTHVVGLPDNGTATLFDQLAGPRPELTLIRVSREGEAFAIATGLWVGGACPVVVIQNTGLLEAGDALRGTALRMRAPLLCLIGYRGFKRTFRPTGTQSRRRAARSPDNLQAVRFDSAALLTEATLAAWSIPFAIPSRRELLAAVRQAAQQAREELRTVAVLLTDPLE